MYLPPVLRPLAVAGPEPPAAQLLAEAAVSVVRGAPGSYAAERLADVVRGWGRWGDSVWLRLRDVRSTDLVGSLAAACQHRWSHADDGTGPTIVAADLRGTLDEGPDGGVVVIELGGRATAEVVELIGTIRPTVTRRRIRVIVVAESRWRPPVRHWPDCIVPACDLDDGGAVDRCAFPQVRARLRMYSGRLPAVVEDVLAAAGQSSPEVVAEALDSSGSVASLLGTLTGLLVDRLTPDQRSALDATVASGYWHPQMGTGAVTVEQLRPWLVPLEQQWGWLRPMWSGPLRKALARPRGSPALAAPSGSRALPRPVSEATPGEPSVPAVRRAAPPSTPQPAMISAVRAWRSA